MSSDDFVFVVETFWWMNILYDELIKCVGLVVLINECCITCIDALQINVIDDSFKGGSMLWFMFKVEI